MVPKPELDFVLERYHVLAHEFNTLKVLNSTLKQGLRRQSERNTVLETQVRCDSPRLLSHLYEVLFFKLNDFFQICEQSIALRRSLLETDALSFQNAQMGKRITGLQGAVRDLTARNRPRSAVKTGHYDNALRATEEELQARRFRQL